MTKSATITITVSQVSATPTILLIPLYIYPVVGAWDALVAAKIANPNVPMVAIVNSASGPGAVQDSNYVGGINYLRSNGIAVLGYVATTFGAKPLATCKTEMDVWQSFYSIDGMFFDEMANSATFQSYYATLNAYAKGKWAGLTVGNPGADVPQSFVGTTFDTLVISEGAFLPQIPFLDGWHASYPKKNFAFIAYGQAALDTNYLAQAKPYVGYLYVTSFSLPNPYGGFPPYLAQLASLLL